MDRHFRQNFYHWLASGDLLLKDNYHGRPHISIIFLDENGGPDSFTFRHLKIDLEKVAAGGNWFQYWGVIDYQHEGVETHSMGGLQEITSNLENFLTRHMTPENKEWLISKYYDKYRVVPRILGTRVDDRLGLSYDPDLENPIDIPNVRNFFRNPAAPPPVPASPASSASSASSGIEM